MNENTAMKVAMVTSGDPRFPPENILDGSVKTFWASTGLFPQELILTFASPTMVKKVTVWSTKVASWTLGRSLSDRPSEFEDVAYQETDDTDPALQVTTFHVPAVAPSSSLSSASPSSSSEPTLASAPPSRHIRLTIRRGHADFCSIHRVAVQGETSGAPFTAATLSGGTSSSYAGRMSTQQAGGAVVVGTGAGGERSSLVMVGGGSH
ncbi:hypothetical protein DFJ73DRAFT_836345 [Zopfochytrium polystomum]|nr:hypothetical protein DFJ73DRAFT_836345 [Zopfochytrium polystomum]